MNPYNEDITIPGESPITPQDNSENGGGDTFDTTKPLSFITAQGDKPEASVALPCPAFGSGGMTISTMVDGGNNANGRFLGTVIGDDKLCYDISFSHLTPEQLMTFLKLFDRSLGGSFAREYLVFDPRINEFVTKTMYIGDRSGRPLRIDKNSFKPTAWADVSARLIEI